MELLVLKGKKLVVWLLLRKKLFLQMVKNFRLVLHILILMMI